MSPLPRERITKYAHDNSDAKAELAMAARLIRELGYGRRYQELEDAEKALG